MKFKNLPESDLQTLREKHANACEKWAKSDKLHPTVDTYTEAYYKGAKHALSLPVMSFSEAAAIIDRLDADASVDGEWQERAWKAMMHGDAKTAQEAIEMTKEPEPPSGIESAQKASPAGTQEPADPDAV